MPDYALLFVVGGIVLGIGAYVLSEVNTAGAFGAGSRANFTILNATEGLSKLSQWYPIIGVVLAAAVIIGLIVTSFMPRGGV